jgi:Protein of unknown function (DUF3618)
MGQDPDAIRQDIEQTRAEMSETVEAIGYKADVPSRAREKVSEKVDNVKSKVSDTASRAKEAVTGAASRAGSAVSDATPNGGEVKQSASRAIGLAQENPLGLAIGAAAIGFLAGLAMPSTRVEDERLGPVADQVKDKVKETGQEALERGKQVAQEATQSAVQTAKEHGQDLAQSAKQNAQEAGSQARSRTTTRS